QSALDVPALRIGEIIVSAFEKRGLFLLNGEGQTIWWRQPPGQEWPREPKATEKWAALRKWGESSKIRGLPSGDYWKFSSPEAKVSSTEVVPAGPHGGEHLAQPPKSDTVNGNSGRKALGSG